MLSFVKRTRKKYSTRLTFPRWWRKARRKTTDYLTGLNPKSQVSRDLQFIVVSVIIWMEGRGKTFSEFESRRCHCGRDVGLCLLRINPLQSSLRSRGCGWPGLEHNGTIVSFKKEFNEVMDTLSRTGYNINCEKSESGDWGCHRGRGQDLIARNF